MRKKAECGPSKTYFQHSGLTVSDSSIVAGRTTIFYPSISAVHLYSGRPLLGAGISLVAGTLFIAVFLVSFAHLFASLKSVGGAQLPMPIVPVILLEVPFFLGGLVCIYYKVSRVLILSGGRQIVIFQSNNYLLVEKAKRAVEQAKAEFDQSAQETQSSPHVTNNQPFRLKP